MGLRPGRPADNGPQEGVYSAWVAWRKGKVRLPGLSFLSPLSLSPRIPRQSSPIGAKPNLYCKAIRLVCGGSPKVCVLVERKALDRVKSEL